MYSQSRMRSGRSSSGRICGSPARCESTSRSVIDALPAWANSGQKLGDAVLERDLAAIREHVQRRRDHALGGRERHRHGVGGPGVAGGVALAGPQVGDLAASVVDADGGAAPAAAHLLLEGARHGPEARLDRAVDHPAVLHALPHSQPHVLHVCEPLSKPAAKPASPRRLIVS